MYKIFMYKYLSIHVQEYKIVMYIICVSFYTEHSLMYNQLTAPTSNTNQPCMHAWVFKHSGQLHRAALDGSFTYACGVIIFDQ